MQPELYGYDTLTLDGRKEGRMDRHLPIAIRLV